MTSAKVTSETTLHVDIPVDRILDLLEELSERRFDDGVSLPSMRLARGKGTRVTLSWREHV